MNKEQSTSGNAAVVIVVAVMLLSLPCAAAIVFVVGWAFLRIEAPAPMALSPVPGATAPLPGTPIPSTPNRVAVQNIQWSQNLFDAADNVLTQARYDQIRQGMTYEELVVALAIPQDRRPPDIELVGPESNVELKWFAEGENARFIAVKMQGLVVIDKTQSGLK